MRKNILLFMPPNGRAVAIESLITEVSKIHNIKLLTLTPEGSLHLFLKEKGIDGYSYVNSSSNSLIRLVQNTLFLIQFCNKHSIDVVWSHLHPCNIYAVFAQYFCKSKFIIFRHHFHAQIKQTGFKGLNKFEIWTEKIICLLAKKIVVPSSEVYNGMVEYEKINPNKIQIIPYLYNFDFYTKPNIESVIEIREEYKSKLIILVASRMIPLKRHFLVLPIFKKLIEEGLDIQILLLDRGELSELIQDYIMRNNLSSRIHLLGFKSNITDYLMASDLIVHPSSTEASSSLIKEAGLYKKTVIVCKGVGDFDEYIENKVNGFSVNEESKTEEFENYIKLVYNNMADNIFGENLYNIVLEKFSVSQSTLNMYSKLIA
jgi:glycosyltransferase involved in cell wall biosynthesis